MMWTHTRMWRRWQALLRFTDGGLRQLQRLQGRQVGCPRGVVGVYRRRLAEAAPMA